MREPILDQHERLFPSITKITNYFEARLEKLRGEMEDPKKTDMEMRAAQSRITEIKAFFRALDPPPNYVAITRDAMSERPTRNVEGEEL